MKYQIKKTKVGRPQNKFEEKGTTIYAKNKYLIKVGMEHDKTLGEHDAWILGKAIVCGNLIKGEGEE
jgi:hypothetical protein